MKVCRKECGEMFGDPRVLGEPPTDPRGRAAVQPAARARQQQRAKIARGQVECACDTGRQRDDGQLRTLGHHGDDPMPPLHAQVLGVDRARLRHPQDQQPEQTGQGVVGRAASGPQAMNAPSSIRSRPGWPARCWSWGGGPTRPASEESGRRRRRRGRSQRRGQTPTHGGPGQSPLVHGAGPQLEMAPGAAKTSRPWAAHQPKYWRRSVVQALRVGPE